jgi:hypothetical protein
VSAVYLSLLIENLRGIKRLQVEGLRRINLIVGRNNSGKSSVLEALLLLGGGTSPFLPSTLGKLRGQVQGPGSPDPVWRPLFRNLDPQLPIVVRGGSPQDGKSTSLTIRATEMTALEIGAGLRVPGEGGIASTMQDSSISRLTFEYMEFRDGQGSGMTTSAAYNAQSGNIEVQPSAWPNLVRTTLLSARFFPSLSRSSELFSHLVKTRQEKHVIQAARLVEPAIQRVEVLSEPGGPVLYVDLGLEALIPLAVCGEGFVRLFSIVIELIAARDGALLIDEVDNGLHYSVMPELWKLLGDLVEKHNVQIFATTHNDDMMRSALEAFAGTEGTLGLFRIDKRGDAHVMVSYSDEAMEAVREVPFEVRG